MSFTTIASAIDFAIRKVTELKECEPPSQSYKYAIDYTYKAFTGGLHGAAIRGPPGTGKTNTARCALIKAFSYIMENEDLVLLHTAPTNELTFEVFTRMFPTIYYLAVEKYGYDIRDVLKMVKILGSGIPEPFYEGDEKRFQWLADGEIRKILRETRRATADTKFVFSTDYQRVDIRGKQFIVFVDEASKHPFYSSFNPVSTEWIRSIIDGKDEIIKSLVIVGDEFQAVALSPEYRGSGKQYLALPLLWEILDKSEEKSYTTLDISFRLPDPIPEILTEGFYKNVGVTLKSGVNLKQRIKELGDKKKDGEESSEYVNDILEAVTTEISTIVYDVKSTYQPGEFTDPVRVRTAINALKAIHNLYGTNVNVMVVAPYSKTIQDVKFGIVSRLPATRAYSYVTTPSALGREADIVITILGKEYPGEKRKTIYYQEPENLNVSLSRARILQIIIGNIDQLKNTSLKKIRAISADLEQRKGIKEDAIREKENMRKIASNLYNIAKKIEELANDDRIILRKK